MSILSQMDSEISDSSISSFFSAKSSRRDTLMNIDEDGCDTDGSDTVTDTTFTPTVSSSSITLSFGDHLPKAEDLLSMSLSINTLCSVESLSSTCSIPPLMNGLHTTRYCPFVSLKSSPFIRRTGRSLSVCSEDLALTTIISAPTEPRLKPLMIEKLYIAGWAQQLGAFCAPEHIPWEDLNDNYTPIPWLSEGSLVSKDRFHEVRHATRPKSYTPPPSPPCEDVPPSLDLFPYPTVVTKRDGLVKRSASFHHIPWRLRREALIIETGFGADKIAKKQDSLLIPASSSEPGKLDSLLKWQKMNTFHESGLERLKKSTIKLLKDYETSRSSEKLSRAALSDCPADIALASETTTPTTDAASVPLAVRRGKKMPSSLITTIASSLTPIPYPDIPTPYRGSPSSGTPLFEFAAAEEGSAARVSMDAADMCNSLRFMIKPLASPSPDLHPDDSSSVDTTLDASISTEGSTFANEDAESTATTPVDEWAFAEDLQAVYGANPFRYFSKRRTPITPVLPPTCPSSPIPDVPAPRISQTGLDAQEALLLSQSSLRDILIPDIIISEEEWKPSPSCHRSSMSFESIFSGHGKKALELRIGTGVDEEKKGSGKGSALSSDEETLPFCPQRKVVSSPSQHDTQLPSSLKRIQTSLKPIKSVRFALSPSKHFYLPDDFPEIATHRPSSFSKRISLRNPSPLRTEFTNTIMADPSTMLQPAIAPKRNRLSPFGFVDGGKHDEGPERLEPLISSTPKSNRFSMIPRSPPSPVPGSFLSKASFEQPRTPAMSRKPVPQLTPKRIGSWTSNLRKYGSRAVGNENEITREEKTPMPRPVTPASTPKSANTPKAEKSKSLDGMKSSKKATIAAKAVPQRSSTPQPRGPIKSGAGISFIASPPRQNIPRSGKENGERAPARDSSSGKGSLRPLRTILGRLAG